VLYVEMRGRARVAQKKRWKKGDIRRERGRRRGKGRKGPLSREGKGKERKEGGERERPSKN